MQEWGEGREGLPGWWWGTVKPRQRLLQVTLKLPLHLPAQPRAPPAFFSLRFPRLPELQPDKETLHTLSLRSSAGGCVYTDVSPAWPRARCNGQMPGLLMVPSICLCLSWWPHRSGGRKKILPLICAGPRPLLPGGHSSSRGQLPGKPHQALTPHGIVGKATVCVLG